MSVLSSQKRKEIKLSVIVPGTSMLIYKNHHGQILNEI